MIEKSGALVTCKLAMIKSRTTSLGTNFSEYTKMRLAQRRILTTWSKQQTKNIWFKSTGGSFEPSTVPSTQMVHSTNKTAWSKDEDFIQDLLQKNTALTLENTQMVIDRAQTYMSHEKKLHTSTTLVTSTSADMWIPRLRFWRWNLHLWKQGPSLLDWSVCLLALKHLVSLQARVRPSVQAELDLHTADRWEERDRKKKKSYICSLKRLPYRRRLAIVFFFSALPKWCVYIFIIGVWVCVCTLLLFAAFYSCRLRYSMCVFYYHLQHYIHTD
jgi:hypothetical protein